MDEKAVGRVGHPDANSQAEHLVIPWMTGPGRKSTPPEREAGVQITITRDSTYDPEKLERRLLQLREYGAIAAAGSHG